MAPLCHLTIISMYLSMRIENYMSLLKVLSANNRQLRSPIVAYLVKSHNSLCAEISMYGKDWSGFYFFLLITLIPFNLVTVHTLFFAKDISWFHVSGYTAAAFSSALYVFYIGRCFAKHCCRLHKTRLVLYRMVVCNAGAMKLANKTDKTNFDARATCSQR